MALNHEDIIQILLTYYPQLNIKESDAYYTLPTLCHNVGVSDGGYNLRLYKNSNLFTCFSECDHTFGIKQLLQKREELEQRKFVDWEAFKTKQPQTNQRMELYANSLQKIQQFARTRKNNVNSFSLNLLQTYDKANTLNPWFVEGIELEILEQFNIGYSKPDNAVIIPHFNFQHKLVGIRRRTYDATNPNKYMPWSWNGQMFTHSLGSNLYGINVNANEIRENKILFLAESEKSVLQAKSAFGLGCVLATCGFNITQQQIHLINTQLKPDIVVVAFDKEYTDLQGAFKYFALIQQKFQSLTNFCEVRVLIDTNNVFNHKESPFDRSIVEFNKLENWRV